MLFRQRHRIQRLHQVQFGFDALEPHFTNDLRAYYNNRSRWRTQVRFGNLYHMQYEQHPINHSPDTHTSHSTTESQDDRHQAAPKLSEPPEPPNSQNQQPNLHPVSNTQTEAEHATLSSVIFSLSLANNTVPPTPFNSLNSSPVHSQNSVPDPHPNLNTDNPPPTSHMQTQNPSCPNPASLSWTWVNGDGPFITNGVLRMTHNSSSDMESDSIISTMFNLDRLNTNRPETRQGVAWRRGQIPEDPDAFVVSLVRRVDRNILHFEVGGPSNGPSIRRTQASAHETDYVSGLRNNLETDQTHIATHLVPTTTQEVGHHQAVSLDTGLR